MMLALAVVLHQHADNKAMGDMLDLIGIITADKVLVFLDAEHAVENVFALSCCVEGDVAALQRSICLGDVNGIAVRAKKRPHAEASGMGCEDAVLFQGIFYFVGILNAHNDFVLSFIEYILTQCAFIVNKEDKFSLLRVNIRPFFSYPV